MKKLLTFLLALCAMFSLTACVIIEEDFPLVMEEDFPIEKTWDSFTFKSLTGGEDLTVERISADYKPLAIATTPYPEDFLAVAVFKTDCEDCKNMAPYLDRLAKDFQPQLFGMNYLIIFLDLFEDSDIKNLEWVEELEHIEAYSNVAAACADGACKKVFIPQSMQLAAGTIYFVNKQNVAKTIKGPSWKTDEEDAEQWYQSLRTKVADVLDLDEIAFDPPSVDDWNNANANVVK